MQPQSVRLEREADEVRWQLSGTLEELRGRMTPGRVVDQVIDYTRDSSAAEFLSNLRREARENPLPLVLIGIGIAWLLVASNRTSRAVIANAADTMARTADDFGTAASAALNKTSEWGQQTTARLADRASDVFGRAKRPFTGASDDALAPMSSNVAVLSNATYEEDVYADERR